MAKNREVSQLGSFITVNDTTGAVGIANSLGVNKNAPSSSYALDVNGVINSNTDVSTENVPSKKVEIIQITVMRRRILFFPCELSDFLPIHGPKIATITIAVEVARPNC